MLSNLLGMLDGGHLAVAGSNYRPVERFKFHLATCPLVVCRSCAVGAVRKPQGYLQGMDGIGLRGMVGSGGILGEVGHWTGNAGMAHWQAMDGLIAKWRGATLRQCPCEATRGIRLRKRM